MQTLRRLSYLALATAFTHLVFGAIVRISGAGMGCGDHWPKCHGQWLPPMNDPLLVIEWTHRLLAVILLISLLLLAGTAWRKRAEPGVAGRGGVLRLALTTPLLWLAPALLGAITVFLGNPPGATVAHWIVAMGLVAMIAATAIRAGALGGASARA
jgi:cytochrome c oxidase assembly protein subunit 15